jgi:S-DNA-T family DNA segregation ATPase FtsK/SpoIIIE
LKQKKVQKKKYKVKEKNQYKHQREIEGILLLALGILMFMSFYIVNSIGLFGVFIREVTLGMLGLPSFLIPPLIILFSLYLIIKHEGSANKKKVFYAAVLFLLFSAMMQTGHYKPEDYYSLSPINSVEKFYLDGKSLAGGGILGGLLSLPFLITFKVLGTIIILTALSLVDIILLTNSSIANFIKNLRLLYKKPERGNSKPVRQKIEAEEGPEIIEDTDGLSLKFNRKSKVIDFKIEKDSRNTKSKLPEETTPEQFSQALNAVGDEVPTDDIQVNLVVNDLKKRKNKPSQYRFTDPPS